MISRRRDESTVHATLSAIEQLQRHRGPDGCMIYTDSRKNGTVVGLGHQRLSILDTTGSGSQPMVSPCGRYLLIYNGEVYNYLELADDLGDDPVLSMSSGDTAVVLAALIRWGAGAFSRFNGMWSVILYDKTDGTVLISRDRLGIKPLYYYVGDRETTLASEVKGVLEASGRRFPVNTSVVAQFLLQGIIDGTNETFFEGVLAVPPASYVKVAVDDLCNGRPLAFERYWHHPFEAGQEATTASPDDLRDLLIDSVDIRLRSDVPVGILLSGGLDSSSILAAAKRSAKFESLHVFSVISDDPSVSEEPYIDLMARHLGITPNKVNVDSNPHEMLDDVRMLSWHSDQPCRRLAEIAHSRLMREAAKSGVTVLLSGQGSDEQLGGYNKFIYFYHGDRLLSAKIGSAASMVGGCLRNGTILNEFRLAEAKRYASFLRGSWASRLYTGRVLQSQLLPIGLGKSYQQREYQDVVAYSIPALLHFEDRVSMMHSREIRVPFLDYRLVEMLARTSPDRKLESGWTKAILRKAMSPLLPSKIAWRKDKKGYTIPEAHWMKTILRERYEALFSGPMLADELGYVRQREVLAAFKAFQKGSVMVSVRDLFQIYAFEEWLHVFSRYLLLPPTKTHEDRSATLQHA